MIIRKVNALLVMNGKKSGLKTRKGMKGIRKSPVYIVHLRMFLPIDVYGIRNSYSTKLLSPYSSFLQNTRINQLSVDFY